MQSRRHRRRHTAYTGYSSSTLNDEVVWTLHVQVVGGMSVVLLGVWSLRSVRVPVPVPMRFVRLLAVLAATGAGTVRARPTMSVNSTVRIATQEHESINLG